MVVLYVPKQLLEVFGKLNLQAKNRRDNAAIVCSTIVKRGGPKVFRGKHARVPFRSLGIRPNSVTETLKLLKEHGIVESDGMASNRRIPKAKRINYGPNRSNGYRFFAAIRESDLVAYEAKTKATVKRFPSQPDKGQRVEYRNELTPTQKLIADKLPLFDVDKAIVDKVLESTNRSIAQWMQLQFYAEQLLHKQHFAVSASTRRLITSLNSCPKTLRAALSVNGEQMAELDAGNCNPLLCCYFMAKSNTVSFQDLSRFQAMTETARLYEEIAEALCADRDAIKNNILTYFCGPHNFRPARLKRQLKKAFDTKEETQVKSEFAILCKIAGWFQTELPTIDAYLEKWKSGRPGSRSYARVSRSLQRLESDIVIEHCCRNIFEKYPDAVITTIHDSLFVPQSFVSTAKKQLQDSFASIGLLAKIKACSVLAA